MEIWRYGIWDLEILGSGDPPKGWLRHQGDLEIWRHTNGLAVIPRRSGNMEIQQGAGSATKEIWRSGDLGSEDMGSGDLGYGDLEIWRSGDLEVCGSGDLEILRSGDPPRDWPRYQ